MEFYDYLLSSYGYDEPILSGEISYKSYSVPWIKKMLKKLCDEEKIIRFEKGIYYIPTDTPLGKSRLDPKKVIQKKYINDGKRTIGYFSGMTVTYLGNKFWVFGKRKGFDDIGKFCIVAFVTYLVSQVSFGLSYNFFRTWLTEKQSFNVSFLPMIFCVTLWSFSMNKIWVFKKR